MMAYRQWVSVSLTPDPARPGKTTKRPINPRTGAHTSVTDPATWGTYAEADARGGAVGFVLTDNDPFWCLDIDNCLQDDGQASPPGNGRRGLKHGTVEDGPLVTGASPPGNGRRGLKLR